MILGLWGAVLAIVERVPALRFRPLPFLRAHFGTDVVYLLTGWVAGGALALPYVRHGSAWAASVTGVDWTRVPFALQVLVALVLVDLGHYLVHLALHRIDALWRFHQAHHSTLALDWMATFRSHLVEQLFRLVVGPLGAIALGLPVGAIVAGTFLFIGWGMLNHANVGLRTRWLERVLVTPRLHRLHHVPATTERNLGTVLSVWDRTLGRLVTDDVGPETSFGLPRERTSYPQGWAGQLVEPFRRVRRADGAATTLATSFPVRLARGVAVRGGRLRCRRSGGAS
jgi:sterol desaturase/sphingolipid hydroxylase (fatty acid hydroxylase superfamily)